MIVPDVVEHETTRGLPFGVKPSASLAQVSVVANAPQIAKPKNAAMRKTKSFTPPTGGFANYLLYSFLHAHISCVLMRIICGTS